MASVSDTLRKCGVKLKATIAGVPSVGSGVVYETPNKCPYNYVLTALHIFQEDSQTKFALEKVHNIEVSYCIGNEFFKLEYLNKKKVADSLIEFQDEDFAILVIEKKEGIRFSSILVHDNEDLDDSIVDFFTWAIFTSNEKELSYFELKRNDHTVKRLKFLNEDIPGESLRGMSGAGVFLSNRNILYGIIKRYPNKHFHNRTIDCSTISFKEVNTLLKSIGRVELDTQTSKRKREIKNKVIDIHQAYVNGVYLDLELARKRVEKDLQDDWYYDPLKYVDLLNQDYLFKQFEDNFENDTYSPGQAEQFYIPKSNFTLRPAIVSSFKDRVMYMALVNTLAPKIEESLIPNVYSARYNKNTNEGLILNGVEQWKKMQYSLSEFANKRDTKGKFEYGCVLEVDLLNFYENIDKDLLIKKLSRVGDSLNEKKAVEVLSVFLKNQTPKNSGLEQNSDASSLLATFYLNQIDTYILNRCPAYFRFIDDIKIFTENKYEARIILKALELELKRCHLSVNSQKTKIYTLIEENPSKPTNDETEKLRSDYQSDLYKEDVNIIARLRRATNFTLRNEAFHKSIELIIENIEKDIISLNAKNKKLIFGLNTIEYLGKKEIGSFSSKPKLYQAIKKTIDLLTEKPDVTTQICKVLNLFQKEEFEESFAKKLKQLLLDPLLNIYSYQTYQIWLLFAKHKVKDIELRKFASEQIDKNDDTNKPVISAMVLYMCSIDKNYRRVILRKFEEQFMRGYFQNRATLIALRKFSSELVDKNKITDESLKNSHEATNKYGNKDLIYVHGYEEDDADEIEQLYSL